MFNSGNPTLDKNLERIARYNPKLAQDLLNLPYLTNKIELVQTNLNEPNLTYNGLPLHSQEGAQKEADEIFNKVENTRLSMHIVFGIGLGHLFEQFCKKSKGNVFLFEPNLEILRVTLELVDFSKELSQRNIFVFSDIVSFKQAFVEMYEYNANVSFKILNSYKQIYADSINETFKQIEVIMGICMTDYNTLKKEGLRSVLMMFDNFAYTLDSVPLKEFEDIYKNKTALIVSAGPSLDLNIEIIKKNRDKVVVFCVGTAFKALMDNGITPDFLTIIEVNNCSEQVKGFDLSNINLVLEPYTNTAFYKLKTKQKILFPTDPSHANNCWARLVDMDISQYKSKGTVSYASLVVAKSMGFSKIILIGQDLAYANNQCYSKDSPYSELIFETNPQTGKPEFKIRDYEKYIKALFKVNVDTEQPYYRKFAEEKVKTLNSTLYFVKGVSGEMIPTQACYATFIEHFREFAYLNKELELINSSMIGAQIDGFKNVPLEEALQNIEIPEKKDIVKTYHFDKNKILENLEKEVQKLKNILIYFAKTKEIIEKYEKEFNRRRTITDESKKLFKKLLEIYDEVTFNYYNKEPLFQIIAFNEAIEVKAAINETEILNDERLKLIYSLLKTYYSGIERKILNILKVINKQKGIINESINSKS